MAEKQDSYIRGGSNRVELHYVLRPAEMKAVLDVLLETGYERQSTEVGSLSEHVIPKRKISHTIIQNRLQAFSVGHERVDEA